MGDDAHMFDDMTPREMYKMLKEARADIMLSGGRTQFVALKAKMPWLDINQERHHAYAGYEGMVELVHEIDKALYNPVWEQVRQPAPWESAKPRSASRRIPHGQRRHIPKACTVNPLKMSQPIGGGAGLHGHARLHAGDARLAGLYLFWSGAVRAPFSRGHPAADHRHERSRHRPWRA